MKKNLSIVPGLTVVLTVLSLLAACQGRPASDLVMAPQEDGSVALTRAESAELEQPTYKNQALQYVGNGIWEGQMLDLYWKPKPEWGANRQWQ